MRKSALLLLAALLAIAAPAMAQGTAQAPAAAQKDMLAIPDAAQQAPQPDAAKDKADKAAALDAEKKGLALKYFDLCTKSILLEQEFDTRALFCSCSADMAMKKLTTEQLKALAAGKGAGIDPDEFSSMVQAPCLSYPLEEIEYKRCLFHDGNLFASQEAHNDMCRCLSSGMADFVMTYGEDLMRLILKRKTVRQDPVHDLTWSREYKSEFAKRRSACITNFASP